MRKVVSKYTDLHHRLVGVVLVKGVVVARAEDLLHVGVWGAGLEGGGGDQGVGGRRGRV